MIKIIKKFVCITIVAIIALSLVSCGTSAKIEVKKNGSETFYSKTSISENELIKAKEILINEPNSETARFLINSMNVRKDNIDDYINYIKKSSIKKIQF